MKTKVIVKIGGSFITDKNKPESLNEENVRTVAREILSAWQSQQISLILSHGAGSYGHMAAEKYSAKKGRHPQWRWAAFYEIRESMIRMNLRLLQIFRDEGLFPITVQPSAIATARAGKLNFIDTRIIRLLLDADQIPLIHGDIIVDESQGFTIASTEDQIAQLNEYMSFRRIVLISDVPGVLDSAGQVIPRIDHKSYTQIIAHLGGSAGADVTGGMKSKVGQMIQLVTESSLTTAIILSGRSDAGVIARTILGEHIQGTIICD
ncbi:MAG: isopentenyl phosphate kinase [Candidatus Zhuqueibacterota bacterium]